MPRQRVAQKRAVDWGIVERLANIAAARADLKERDEIFAGLYLGRFVDVMTGKLDGRGRAAAKQKGEYN